MSKNIVVLSDGTGQEGGKGHDTNVYKLFRMLEDRTDKQVVFYDEGLGTDWRKFTGNAFGAGFSKNLLQCYQFIFENYNAGDRIYLFGFSRGAATVRSLASFIHYFGILPKSRPELIKKAFKLYRRGQDEVSSDLLKQTYKLFQRGQVDEVKDELNKKATEFVHEHPNQWAKIEFLGVWDTVPALGLVALAGLNTFLGKVLRFNFHSFRLHPSVKNAYHALSIDDDRLWFHPSLWTEKTREEQIVEQVWFSGAHTDVGGGFNEPGLSDITLEWMLDKAISYGLRIYLGSRQYWNFVVAPDPTDLYHPPRAGFGKIFVKGLRNDVWDKQGASAAFGQPIIHSSVLERHTRSIHMHGNEPEHEDDKTPWILKQTTKSSILYKGDKFKKFLSQKFYETLKYEWKKYDWGEDKQQDKKFDEWIKESKYKEYYNSYDWGFQKIYLEDGYKKYCIDFWNNPEKDPKQELETRIEWMEHFSNLDWLKGYQPYQDWLKEAQDYLKEHKERLKPDWLDSYQPYKDWLEEHTVKHDKQTYYVEPFKKLVLRKEEDFNCYGPSRDDGGKKSEELDKNILSLRDYEEETLEKIFKEYEGTLKNPVKEVEITSLFRKLFRKTFTVVKLDADENKKAIRKINSKKKELVKRGINEDKKKHDRIGYDLSRWMGINSTYKTLFSKKEDSGEQTE